jgi:hypothetical protein
VFKKRVGWKMKSLSSVANGFYETAFRILHSNPHGRLLPLPRSSASKLAPLLTPYLLLTNYLLCLHV